MPYKRVGNEIYVKKGGKWRLKQRCKDSANAESALRLLRAIKHGFEPKQKG